MNTSVFIVDGVCWSEGALGNPSCQGTKETIEQCEHCLRYQPVNGSMKLNTYLVKSATNYGEVVHVVNANDEAEVRNIVLNNDEVWDGYEIEEVDKSTKGIVAVAGGD